MPLSITALDTVYTVLLRVVYAESCNQAQMANVVRLNVVMASVMEPINQLAAMNNV
jgi:hypothetical protein